MMPRLGPVRPRAQSPPSPAGRSVRKRRATDERIFPVSLRRLPSIDTHELLALQRAAGNRAVGLVVQRQASATGTAEIDKLMIKVGNGNLGEWANISDADWKDAKIPDSLEVTSNKGRHSKSLARLSRESTRIDLLKVTTMATASKAGEGQKLEGGGSIAFEFSNARIKGYEVNGETESWRVSDFAKVNRTKTTWGLK